MAKNKFVKFDGVPPIMPIDWRAWQSSSMIQSMSMTQQGIAFNIMLKQWVNGTVPRSAWDLAREIKADFQTTRRFLLTHSKFLACCECGNSWTPVDCECGASEASGRCQSNKLKNFYIDVNSGLPLGTTEPNLTYTEQNKTRPCEGVGDGSPVPLSVGVTNRVEVEEIEDETEEVETAENLIDETPNPQHVAKTFMDAFDLKMKTNRFLWSWDICYEAFTEFLKTHEQSKVLKVIRMAAANPMYKRGAKTINADKQRPWDWFIEKYPDIVDKFEADEEFNKTVRKQAREAVVGGHAALNPELHTGLDGQGVSWTEGKTKI